MRWDPERERYLSKTNVPDIPEPTGEPTVPAGIEDVAACRTDARVLATLPAATSSSEVCPVCFEVLSSSVELPCGHRLHRHCAEPWLRQKGSCPTCRRCVDVALEIAARAAQ